MNDLNRMLAQFEPVSLDGMKKASLLKRHDTKFVFHQDQLDAILSDLMSDYCVLQVEGHRKIGYHNLYYDTENFSFYTNHHNGKMNRYKIRMRKYVENDLNYFEVKFKNNKGRTEKERIKVPNFTEEIDETENAFLIEMTPFEKADLKPALYIDFTRITLVEKNFKDRLTLDFNLRARINGSENIYETIVIGELKQNKYGDPSEFLKVMKRNRVYEMRISKYCLGMAHFHPELKHNRFKERLLKIDKLMYGRTA